MTLVFVWQNRTKTLTQLELCSSRKFSWRKPQRWKKDGLSQVAWLTRTAHARKFGQKNIKRVKKMLLKFNRWNAIPVLGDNDMYNNPNTRKKNSIQIDHDISWTFVIKSKHVRASQIYWICMMPLSRLILNF